VQKKILLVLSLTLGVSCAVNAAQDTTAQDVDTLLNQRLGAEVAKEVKQEKLALAKRKRLEVIGQGNAVLKNLTTLEAAAKAWEDRIKALETNAEGQRIALDSARVEAYSALRKKTPIDQGQIDTLKEQVEATLSPIKAASDESPAMPSEDTLAALKQDAETTRKALEEYERLQARINLLVHKSAGQSVPPGSPSLKIALEEYERGQVERESAIEEDHRIKDEEIIRQAKVDQARAQAEKEAERIRQDTQMQQATADHDRLVKIATSEAVINRYAPFLAKGERVLKQPSGDESKRFPDRNGFWPKVDNPQPLSYSVLNQWGAFSKVEMFSHIALEKWNPRPKGDFRQPTTDAEWKEMQKRLDDFRKYAPIWQEKGLLTN
jgi:hypothetical protein